MGRPKKPYVKAGTAPAKVVPKAVKIKGNFSNQRSAPDDDGLEMIMDAKTNEDDDDDEGDDEVFDLDGDEDEEDDDDDDDDDDEDDDDNEDDDNEDDDDEDEDDEDDDEDEEDDEENELKNLVNRLDPKLRQKVMMGAKGQVADSDDEEEEDGKGMSSSWGKKKAYWDGDTADLEIGQDVQDAEDEEEAAEELQRQKLDRMQESDYFEDFGDNQNHLDGNDDDDDDDDDDGKTSSSVNRGRQKRGGNDRLMGELEQLALGEDDGSGSMQVEQLARDVSKLTDNQKLSLIKTQSPELLGLVAELKEHVKELREQVLPLRALVAKKVANSEAVDEDVVKYLEIKQQLMLSYGMNVVFYLFMKAQGSVVRGHPVMRQLLEFRYAMEKMRILDGKLQHDLDALQQQNQVSVPSNARAVASKAVSKAHGKKPVVQDDEDDEEAEDDDDDEEGHDDGEDDDEEEGEDEDEDEEEEEAEAAWRAEEEERFVRSSLSRKEKQSIQKRSTKASRSDEFNSIGDIGEYDRHVTELSKIPNLSKSREEDEGEGQGDDEEARLILSRMLGMPVSKGKGGVDNHNPSSSSSGSGGGGGDEGPTTNKNALQRTLQAFAKAQKQGVKTSLRESDDHLGPLLDRKSIAQKSGKTAKKDDSDDDDDDDDDDDKEEEVEGDDDDDDDDDEEDMATFMRESNKDLKKLKKQKKTESKGLSKGKAAYNDFDGIYEDDEENHFGGDFGEDQSKKDRKRRRAPDEAMNGDDDEDGSSSLLNAFANKKKEFIAKKKAHYTVEPKYGGRIESLPASGKRAASYEIMKNRGLTPHRKKENKNPRVKKRHAYEKALVRRKGQVRDVIEGGAAAYGGELTGIKANLSRSRKIGN